LGCGPWKTILSRVADGLGVSEPVTAQLYKLSMYDRGSFFVSREQDLEDVARIRDFSGRH
jgi:hypothetical protein